MSVPVNQRKQGKLDVFLKARDLCCYTLQITANKKIFVPDYQESVTNKIIEAAMNVHLHAWMANNCRVTRSADYEIRRKFQNLAISDCVSLLSLIDIAQPLFHLSGKRVVYWSTKVIETRNLISAWKASDAQRYKNLNGM
jgi:hypothetical protein